MPATAVRQLFVNWVTKTLQISDRNGGEFILPAFVKYETIPFEICVVEPALDASGLSRFNRVDISNLSISVAINDTLDDASPLAYQPTFTKDEDLNVFSGELALNTAGMNAYIGSNSSIAAYFEIEIQEGTSRNKIYLSAVTLKNSVTKVSSTAPTPVDEYLTKAQTSAQFAQKVLPAGDQFTITSPSGTYQRIFGVDDGGAPIDIILPV